MIIKFKDFLSENQNVDKILDKISKSGINSLTKQEKDYLDKFSRGEDVQSENDMKGQTFVSDNAQIPTLSFVYDKTENLGDHIKHFGELTFGDTIFTGFISCDKEGNFRFAEFFDVLDTDVYDETDLYTIAEGLEQEIDSFFADDVCPYL